jgi:hypothetical protein
MAMVHDNEQVARAFIAALMAGTPDESLFEATATGQHNFDAAPGPIQDGFKSTRFIRRFVPDFRFDEMRVHPSERACTLQYVIRGSLPDGSVLEAPACIVLTFSPGGRIASLEEYLDTAQVRGLSDLMAAAPERRAVDRTA